MSERSLEEQLAEINGKLTILTEFVTAQQERQRARDELLNDLSMVGRDMFQAAITELEDVAGHFETRDLLHLLKKLLRNTRNLSRMLDQIESAQGFFEDMRPLAGQMFRELLQTLDELDRRGYFAFGREMLALVDEIVTSLKTEDVVLLRQNIVAILGTVRNLTQPEVLQAVNRAVGFYGNLGVQVEKDVSLGALLRRLRDPEVRRGIAFLLEFARQMSRSTPTVSTEQSMLPTKTGAR